MSMSTIKDLFGRNISHNINWENTFKLLRNNITTSYNVTSEKDNAIRAFRMKNLLQILLTYKNFMG